MTCTKHETWLVRRNINGETVDIVPAFLVAHARRVYGLAFHVVPNTQ